jgi:hypothetical protein
MQQNCISAALTLDDEFPYVFHRRFAGVTARGGQAIRPLMHFFPHRCEIHPQRGPSPS